MRRIASLLAALAALSPRPAPADDPPALDHPTSVAGAPATPAAGDASVGLPADLIAARKETAERIEAAKAPEKGKETAAGEAHRKAIHDLLDERKKILDQFAAAIRDHARADVARAAAPREGDVNGELEHVEALLARARANPDVLLSESFRADPPRDREEVVLGEMKGAIVAAQDAAADAKGRLDACKALGATRSSRGAAMRTDRDEIQRRSATLKSLRDEVDATLAGSPAGEAREVAKERRTNLDWQSRLDAERYQEIEAQIADEARVDRTAAITLRLDEAQLERETRTLRRLQARYERLVVDRESELRRSARQEKARASDAANDPLERFRARRSVEILDLQALILKDEKSCANIPAITPATQSKLAEEAEKRFEKIRELVAKGRSSNLAATQLTTAFRGLAAERAGVVRGELAQCQDWQARLETRLTEVEMDLLSDSREDQAARESLLASLPESRRAEADEQAEKFNAQHQKLMEERRDKLMHLAGQVEAAKAEVDRRIRVLDDEHTFLRTHLFWVRDAVPIGPATISQASIEAGRVARAAGPILAAIGRSSSWGSISAEFAGAFLALACSPPLLLWGGRVARRWARPGAAATRSLAATIGEALVPVAASAIWPAYVGLAAFAARMAPWPRPFARIVAFVVGLLAVDLLAVLASRALLGPGGWTEAYMGVPREVCRPIRRSILVLAIVGGVALIPGWVIQRDLVLDQDRPVSAPVLVRLGVLSFEVVAFVLAAGLLRRKSAPMAWLVGESAGAGRGIPGLLRRRQRPLTIGLLAAAGAVIALDAMGYAFSARKFWLGGLQVAILLIGSGAAYRLADRMIEMHAWRWLRKGAPPGSNGGATAADGLAPDDLARRLRRLAAWTIPGLAALLAAWLWNVDLALFETIAKVDLWPGEGKGLNVGDVTLSICAVVATIAVRGHLETFFAVVVYPRMRDDAGLQFAVLTLCRYAVVGAGTLAALTAVHLGIDQIKFVLAAVGVGLGFGLQEIVSNFISGIILLVERPIRVGDVVTVSGMSGKVDKIHIRATTIINADNQSMIVPNREFITSNLINWTHKDRVVRVSVPVRVPLGADPERASDLLLAVARDDVDVLRSPMPTALMDAFGESWLSFTLHCHVGDPGLAPRAKHRLCSEIQRRFDLAGIAIPLPAREFHFPPNLEVGAHPNARPDVASSPIPAPHLRPSFSAAPAPAADCHRGVDD